MSEAKKTNPMRNPEVAKRQSEALKARWADPEFRAAQLAKQKPWDESMREKQSRRAKNTWRSGRGMKWTDEMKANQSQKINAYWAKVRAALASMGESQHDRNATT